jgi:hypothetical protein
MKPDRELPRTLSRVPVPTAMDEGMKRAQCAGKRRDGKTRREMQRGIVYVGEEGRVREELSKFNRF